MTSLNFSRVGVVSLKPFNSVGFCVPNIVRGFRHGTLTQEFRQGSTTYLISVGVEPKDCGFHHRVAPTYLENNTLVQEWVKLHGSILRIISPIRR